MGFFGTRCAGIGYGVPIWKYRATKSYTEFEVFSALDVFYIGTY